jgi:hypothetical protein
MSRMRRALVVGAAVLLLAGCGKPPELRGPQGTPTIPGLSSAPVAPSEEVPVYPTLDPLGNPPPAPPPPVNPPPQPPVPPPPAKAPKCTSGPTAAQLRAVLGRSPSIPSGADLKVVDGPYCADDWQYTVVRITVDSPREPLRAITKGKPNALTLVEIGSDVCSPTVASDAPAGIRTHACGTNPVGA